MTETAAIIVAAGRGTRAGGDLPKQWQVLAGQTVLARTLAAFRAHPDVGQIVLVIHPDDRDRADAHDHDALVAGGTNRAASVVNGLRAADAADCVLIHDAARPLIAAQTISAVLGALDTHPGAAPALPVTDALWTGAQGLVTGTQSRDGLFRAQTPQGFHRDAILMAHEQHTGDAADDVAVAVAAGLPVAIVPGEEDNLKITHASDFARAEAILRGRDGHQTG
ncbi:MAG: 2-C-methyl-D-erythritol 4-phosphate cytidylyltransferase [Pseudomonadota bacterium]